MRVRRISLLFTLLALIAFVAGLALAQLNEGGVDVTVSSCGQVLPGATVTITVGGVPRATPTNAQGIARFEDLAVGSYTATAELAGYAQNDGAFTIEAGKTASLGITLQPAICEDYPDDESCCQKRDR